MIVYIVILLFGTLLFYNYHWKRRKLPPGPTPLPLIGNLLSFGRTEAEYDVFENWKKQFGEIYTVWASEKPIVFLADYQLLVDTFVKEADAFAGRYCVGKFNERVRGGDYGIVFTDGPNWQEHRKFALQVFRDFGMGKGLMEDKILQEVGHLLESTQKALDRGEKEQNLIPLIELTVASVINQLLFGFAYHDEELIQRFIGVKDTIAEHMKIATKPEVNLSMHHPDILRMIPFFRKAYDSFVHGYLVITQYCREQVSAHKKSLDPNTAPRDYVEAYLMESARHPEVFNEAQLVNCLYDMFIAGQETTANTIVFAVLYALNNPTARQKVYAELDKVIGGDRSIGVADRTNLPYTNAFIYETLRLVNLLPQNLPHRTTRPVNVRGYDLPKGTVVIGMISSVLYDEKVFPEPLSFKPERFLNADGELQKVSEFVPFSLGKRQCLGESLARMELFLIIANFFNQFDIGPVDTNNPPSLKKMNGVTVQPEAFTCFVQKRF